MGIRQIAIALLITMTSPNVVAAPSVEIAIHIPDLKVSPYHRPYVAVWLEDEQRNYVTTIALWADDMEWHKDLRQWWRKAGRSEQSIDAVTGATRKPGNHQISWAGNDSNGRPIPAGSYILKIEASREEGGREYVKTPITIDLERQITIDLERQITLQGKRELGQIKITPIKQDKQ